MNRLAHISAELTGKIAARPGCQEAENVVA
jgi:hypothetical protein